MSVEIAHVAPTGSGHAMAVDISIVSRYWADFDLEGRRAGLDEVGLKVAEHQENAMQNRKKLADATKDFRKTFAEDPNAKAYGLLLRLYQEEIDRLTKRAKHGEGAFLNIYEKLSEAPDPSPALSMAFETASRAADLEAQLRKVSQELAEYKAESTQIKNQDLTIRKLEEKVRALEAHADEKDREVIEAHQKAAAEADAARMAQMQEREAELTAMLSAAHGSMAAMQKLHQASQNQLFAIQSASEEESIGRQTELELASTELERAQERLAALGREKQQLVKQLASQQEQGPDKPQAAPVPKQGLPNVEESLRSELGMQREVSARLRSEVASLKRDLDEVHTMWEARMEGLRATQAATEQHAQALERELGMRPSLQLVEDLRQQIRVLQAIGYNTVDADDEDAGAARGSGGGGGAPSASPPATGASGRGGIGSLESALLHKNRHLEHELTMARLRGVDTKADLDAALARLTDLENQVAEKLLLVNRLEEDLLASRGAQQAARGGGADGKAGAKGGSAKLSGLLGAAADTSRSDGDEGEDGAGQDASMLRVLCSQRDRFRAKAVELEEELARVKTELSAAKSEAAAARADNVALVERLRYVHGYRQGRSDVGRDVEAGTTGVAGVDVERKYTRIYEEGINPFKEFQGQQRERQKQRMGVVDKAMYKFGHIVFGSQPVRIFTFFYLLMLHLLVFGSLVRMTHHSSNQLYQHQQLVLDSKHAAMGVLHNDGQAVLAAVSAPRLP